MPEELKNTDKIMEHIRQGRLKMKPRVYFLIGSVLTFMGLVTSIAASVFAVGAIRFLFRSNGVLSHKLDKVFSVFPWWLLVLAVLGLVLGVILIRKYDISYKIGLKKAVVAVLLTVFVSGWLVDALGFNDFLAKRGLMRGMMRNPSTENIFR